MVSQTYRMNSWRQSELFDFARSGDIRGVIGLLEQRLVNVNTTNRWNQTALYIACKKGHTAMARYLLKKGAHVCCGQTNPLIAAVRYNHYDCVKLLLENHADANCRSAGETPMSVALQKHPTDIELILLLLRYDGIPLESFAHDIAVQLLKHTNAQHARAIRAKLINGNLFT